MTPHRLIEAHLNTVEQALDQMSDIRVDRYLEEALTPQRMNLRIRIRFVIFRYDNTPHFPDLPSFPHHKHLPSQVIACTKPKLIQVFQEALMEPQP
jgi:LPS O-antigen subunit length determinant protein (WzzB/FepE family)